MSKDGKNIKLPKAFPFASERKPGWLEDGDHVVLVRFEKDNDYPKILTGHMTRVGPVYGKKEKGHRVMIWFDQRVNKNADHADDAHEIGVDIDNPHLFRIDEAELLKNYNITKTWFCDKYPEHVIRFIVDALSQQGAPKSPVITAAQKMIKLAGNTKSKTSGAKPAVSWWRRSGS